MNIKIHRGLEQIGGCITEISTENSRVFIDMGQNLESTDAAGTLQLTCTSEGLSTSTLQITTTK